MDVASPSTPPANALWEALTGPHAGLAERNGHAVRYQSDVAPFAALDPHAQADSRAWADLADLVGAGSTTGLAGTTADPPRGWTVTGVHPGTQLVGTAVAGRPDPEAEPLGFDDVPEMLDLVARTRPGPFSTRTLAMGAYLGIRCKGELVAVAGERVRVPGWTEISTVCTDPRHRGRGLATRLVLAVADGIRQRGDLPFLHVVTANTAAIRLYRSLGFTRSRDLDFTTLTAPGQV